MSDTQYRPATTRERVFNPETRRALRRELWVGLFMALSMLLIIGALYVILYHAATFLFDNLNHPLEQDVALGLAGSLLAVAGVAWGRGRRKLIRTARETSLTTWQALRREAHYALLTCYEPHCTPGAIDPAADECPARVFNAETRTALRRVLRAIPHVMQDGAANGGDINR